MKSHLAAAQQCLDKLIPQQRERVQTHRVDMGRVYGPVCNREFPNSRLIVDRFHVAKHFGDVADKLRKKATGKHKAKLSKAERFRALMWEFRRDPDDLKPGERTALESLFAAAHSETPVRRTDTFQGDTRYGSRSRDTCANPSPVFELPGPTGLTPGHRLRM